MRFPGIERVAQQLSADRQPPTAVSNIVRKAMQVPELRHLDVSQELIATYDVRLLGRPVYDGIPRGVYNFSRAAAAARFPFGGVSNPKGSGRAFVVNLARHNSTSVQRIDFMTGNGGAAVIAASASSAVAIDRSGMFLRREVVGVGFMGDAAAFASIPGTGAVGNGLLGTMTMNGGTVPIVYQSGDDDSLCVLYPDEVCYFIGNAAASLLEVGFTWTEHFL